MIQHWHLAPPNIQNKTRSSPSHSERHRSKNRVTLTSLTPHTSHTSPLTSLTPHTSHTPHIPHIPHPSHLTPSHLTSLTPHIPHPCLLFILAIRECNVAELKELISCGTAGSQPHPQLWYSASIARPCRG